MMPNNAYYKARISLNTAYGPVKRMASTSVDSSSKGSSTLCDEGGAILIQHGDLNES